MKKNKYLKNGQAYLACAFLIMVLLFVSSAQTYEQQSQVSLLSKLLAGEPFKKSLTTVSFYYGDSPVSIHELGYPKFIEFFIRKAAHFFSYFFLAFFGYLGLQPRIKQPLLTGVVSWLSATGYAGLDEFHQMMTGGRTPMFQDVFLDSMGALTAVTIFLCIALISRIKKRLA